MSKSTPSSADVPEEQDEVDADAPVDRAVVVDVAAHHGEVALATPQGSTEFRLCNDTFKSPRSIVGLAWNTEFFGDYLGRRILLDIDAKSRWGWRPGHRAPCRD